MRMLLLAISVFAVAAAYAGNAGTVSASPQQLAPDQGRVKISTAAGPDLGGGKFLSCWFEWEFYTAGGVKLSSGKSWEGDADSYTVYTGDMHPGAFLRVWKVIKYRPSGTLIGNRIMTTPPISVYKSNFYPGELEGIADVCSGVDRGDIAFSDAPNFAAKYTWLYRIGAEGVWTEIASGADKKTLTQKDGAIPGQGAVYVKCRLSSLNYGTVLDTKPVMFYQKTALVDFFVTESTDYWVCEEDEAPEVTFVDVLNPSNYEGLEYYVYEGASGSLEHAGGPYAGSKVHDPGTGLTTIEVKFTAAKPVKGTGKETFYWIKVATESDVCGNELISSWPVSVKYMPPASGGSVVSGTDFCEGQEIMFEATGEAGLCGDDIYNNYIKYTWQKKKGDSWTPVRAGETFTIKEASGADAGEYRRKVEDSNTGSGCGAYYTEPVTVSVHGAPDPGALTIGKDLIVEGDSPGKITGTEVTDPYSGGPAVYSWGKMNLSTKVETALSGTGHSITDAGALYTPHAYTRTAAGECGEASASLTVNVAGALTTANIKDSGNRASPLSACQGNDIVLYCPEAEGGEGNYSYRWEISDESLNFTLSPDKLTLTLENVQPGKITVSRVAASGGKTAETADYIINVKAAPVRPELNAAKLRTCEGVLSDALLSVTESTKDGSVPEGGYAWEWMTDGSSWHAATSSNATDIYPYPYNEDGRYTYYRVTADNGCGAATSEMSVLETYGELSIVQVQRDKDELCPGEELEMAIVPYGGDTGDYRCMWAETGGSGYTIFGGGAWDAPLAAKYSSAEPGSYQIFAGVKSGNCPAVHKRFSVTVREPANPGVVDAYDDISREFHTDGQLICHGTAPIELQAYFGGKGDYIWEQSADGKNFVPAEGAGVYGSEFQPAALTSDTWFRFGKSDGCGYAYTDPYKVTVLPQVVFAPIEDRLATQEICHGSEIEPILLELPSGGFTGSYRWQWYKKTSWGWRTYASTMAFPGNGRAQRESGEYYYTVASYSPDSGTECPAITGETVKITVLGELTDNIIEANQTVKNGGVPAELTGSIVTGGDGSGAGYAWEQKKESGTWLPACSGAACGTDLQPGALTETTYFRRSADISGCASGYSNTVEITVYDAVKPPVIGTENGKLATCYNTSAGNLVIIQEAEGGEGAYYYQWEEKQGAIGSEAEWKGIGTGEAVTLAAYNSAGTRSYRLRVISSVSEDTAYSKGLQIATYEKVDPGYIENDVFLGCNNSVVFTPKVEPTPPTGGDGMYEYLWYWSSDGGITYNPTDRTASYLDGVHPNASKYYKRRVINNCAEEGNDDYFTNEYKIEIVFPLVSGTISDDQIICEGTQPELIEGSESGGGTGRMYYVWQKSQTREEDEFFTIPNSNKASYTPPILDSTAYFRRATVDSSGTCFAKYSNSVRIETAEPLAPAVLAGDTTLCEGSYSGFITELSAPSGGDEIERYWEISYDNSEWSRLGKYTGYAYLPEQKADSTFFVRQVAASLNCEDAVSAKVTVEVLEAVQGGTLSTDYLPGMNCAGAAPQRVSVSGETGGAGSQRYTYRWEESKNGKLFAPADTGGKWYVTDTLYADRYYRVRVTDSMCGHAYSDTLRVQVASGLQAGTLPGEQVAFRGAEPGAIAPEAQAKGGTGEYSYFWHSSPDGASWSEVEGADSASFQPAKLSGTAYFMLEVQDGCSSDSSNVHTVAVLDRMEQASGNDTAICRGTSPGIITLPDPEGGRMPYSFRWEQSADGKAWEQAKVSHRSYLDIEEALETTMQYRRTAWSEGVDTVTSAPLVVKVLAPVSRPVLSGGQEVCYGTGPVDIEIKNSSEGGSGVYTNTWYTNREGNFKAEGYGWAFQPGALTSKLKVFVKTEDSLCGSALSDTVAVTVLAPFAAGKINAEETVSYGTGVQVDGTAAKGGSGIYEYIFRVASAGSTFLPVFSEENSTGMSRVLYDTAYIFRTDIDSVCGTLHTDTIKINVLPKLISGSMADIIKPCNMEPVWLRPSAPAGGNGVYSFAWFRAGAGGVFSQLLYADADSLLTEGDDTTAYYMQRVISAGDTAFTSPVKIVPYAAVYAPVIAGSQKICPSAGPLAVEVVSGAGGGRINNGSVWQVSADGAEWTPYDSVYYPADIIIDSSASLYVRLASGNSCGQTISNKIYLERLKKITNNYIESNSRFVEYGTPPETLLGSVPTGGNGSYSYQYQVSADSGATWKAVVSDGNLKDYAPPALFGASMYRRIVFDFCGEDTSGSVTVDILPQLVAGTISASHSVCKGTEADTLRGTALSGGDGTAFYAWQRSPDGLEWALIADANGTDYAPGAVSEDTWYRREDSSSYLPVKYTEAVKVSVYHLPSAPPILGENVYCKGSDIVLTADSSLVEGRTYLWTMDGNEAGTGRSLSFVAVKNTAVSAQSVSPHGCRSAGKSQLTVAVDSADADFYAETDSIYRTSAAHFEITTENVASAEWEFYDGDGSTRLAPFHYYYAPGLYDVTLSIETVNGCTSTVTKKDYIYVSGTTGVSVNTGAGVSALPSPFSGELVISAGGGFSYEITGTGGAVLLSGKGEGAAKANTSALAPGIYFISVKTPFGTGTVKTVKY